MAMVCVCVRSWTAAHYHSLSLLVLLCDYNKPVQNVHIIIKPDMCLIVCIICVYCYKVMDQTFLSPPRTCLYF